MQECGIIAHSSGGPLGVMRAKRAGQRSRTVREDWSAWLPNEMDQLFDATRHELESSNVILSIALDEALALCEAGTIRLRKGTRNGICGPV